MITPVPQAAICTGKAVPSRSSSTRTARSGSVSPQSLRADPRQAHTGRRELSKPCGAVFSPHHPTFLHSGWGQLTRGDRLRGLLQSLCSSWLGHSHRHWALITYLRQKLKLGAPGAHLSPEQGFCTNHTPPLSSPQPPVRTSPPTPSTARPAHLLTLPIEASAQRLDPPCSI